MFVYMPMYWRSASPAASDVSRPSAMRELAMRRSLLESSSAVALLLQATACMLVLSSFYAYAHERHMNARTPAHIHTATHCRHSRRRMRACQNARACQSVLAAASMRVCAQARLPPCRLPSCNAILCV
jgi:hypothetical protein